MLGVTVYGSLLLLYYLDCDFSGSPWNLVHFARAAVAFHWVAIGATLLANLLAFNPFPEHADLASWQARFRCLCCCVDSTDASSGGGFEPLPEPPPPPSGPLSPSMPAAAGPPLRCGDEEMGGIDTLSSSSHYHPMPSGSNDGKPGGGVGGTMTRRGSGSGSGNGGAFSRPSRASAPGPVPSGTSIVPASAAPSSHLAQVAATLHGIFSHVDLTLSDYATSLLLVGIKHHLRKEQQQQQQEAEVVSISGSPAGSLSLRIEEGPVAGGSGGAGADAAASVAAAEGPAVEVEVLRDAVHYFKHACAVFGWPMHMWIHKGKPTRWGVWYADTHAGMGGGGW